MTPPLDSAGNARIYSDADQLKRPRDVGASGGMAISQLKGIEMTKSHYRPVIIALAALIAIAICLSWASRSAASVVHLRANQQMRSWQSQKAFDAHDLIEDAVVVDGHSLVATIAAGCRVTWAGRGIAVLAKTCGRGPVELHYVAFGRPKEFKFIFAPAGSHAR